MRIITSLVRAIFFLVHPQVPLWVKTIPIWGFVYLIWPRDLLFDFSLGFGLLDDLIVLALLTRLFIKVSTRKINQKQNRESKVKTIEANYKLIDENNKDNKH